jgi:hypothetical protein
MPGTAFAISAALCIAGSKLAKVVGSTCHGCYALRTHYIRANPQKAMRKRMAGLSDTRWVEAVVTLLRHKHSFPEFRIDLGIRDAKARGLQRWRMNASGWHRWHDSGDLQGVWHLAKICEVAAQTPKIRHWLATRETQMVLDYVSGGGIIPNNMVIRVSAAMVDRPPPKAWPLTSTVHDLVMPSGHICPAPEQNHECGSCRACWSKDVANVSYQKH